MRYYILSGEASGDLHGANLIKALKHQDQNAEFRVWGGNLMEQEGAVLVKHYKDLAFMGFIEVVKNLPTIFKNLKFCKQDILRYKPDVLILIDYPGFNLRIAPFAKSLGIPVVYYISPQIWAWKTNRVHSIKKNVDKMLTILPFEKDFYAKYDMDVDYVGHPLLDAIEEFKSKDQNPLAYLLEEDARPIIALLPGSRKQEILKKLPIMLSVVDDFPAYQFVIAGAPGADASFYKALADKKAKFIQNKTYDLLRISHAALVTSGTATLETALFNIPQVVCYKGSWVSYEIGKRIVKHIEYISLVNLILDENAVKELIQNDLTKENLLVELNKIVAGKNRENLLLDYKKLQADLGGKGASERAATEIIKLVS